MAASSTSSHRMLRSQTFVGLPRLRPARLHRGRTRTLQHIFYLSAGWGPSAGSSRYPAVLPVGSNSKTTSSHYHMISCAAPSRSRPLFSRSASEAEISCLSSLSSWSTSPIPKLITAATLAAETSLSLNASRRSTTPNGYVHARFSAFKSWYCELAKCADGSRLSGQRTACWGSDSRR